MCVRDRHHGDVLVYGGAAHGRHGATSGHALPVPRRHQLAPAVRQLPQGKVFIVFLQMFECIVV